MSVKKSVQMKRHRERYLANSSRVITRFFDPGGEERMRGLISRVLSIPESGVSSSLTTVLEYFGSRHRDMHAILLQNYAGIARLVPDSENLGEERKLLLGAYFTSEYSIESAALFNPCIMPHPDQSNVPDGGLRFILSLRATGEGHISSLTFRSGILDRRNIVLPDPVSPYVETPEVELNPEYDHHTFLLKLEELGANNYFVRAVFSELPERFSLQELEARMQHVEHENPESLMLHETMEIIDWVAESNYLERFRPASDLSERVIFPVARHESNGIEDARFTLFSDGDGSRYLATYTASDGLTILPMLLETRDFLTFSIRTLNGSAMRNKGPALFPRRVNGKYMMIGRQDGENLYLLESDNLHFWNEARLLQKPEAQWELVQLGNCGSPLETEAGWLLLTHGVGPLRKYCIGVMLLDLEDPGRVIGRLKTPLIEPLEHEREGYVPNVVYTCGGIIHADALVIPYAVSDTSSGLASVPLEPLLAQLKNSA